MVVLDWKQRNCLLGSEELKPQIPFFDKQFLQLEK